MKNKMSFEDMLDLYQTPPMQRDFERKMRARLAGERPPFLVMFIRQAPRAFSSLACCLLLGILIGSFTGFKESVAEVYDFMEEITIQESFYD